MSQMKLRHLKALETAYEQLKDFMQRNSAEENGNGRNSAKENGNGRNSAKDNGNSRNSGKRKRRDSGNAAAKKKNRRLQGTKAANFCEVKDATTRTKFRQAFETIKDIHKVTSYKDCLIRDTEPKLEAIMVC